MKYILLLLGLVYIVSFTSCKEPPIPCFEYEVVDEYTYDVSFKNCSELGLSYEWEFGDGNTSTEENPTHSYDLPGAYSVKLLVQGEKDALPTTQTVEVALPVDLNLTDPAEGTKRGDDLIIPVEMRAVNGISNLTCVHYYGGLIDTLLNEDFDGSETDKSFDFKSPMPLIYQPESRFSFTVSDANQYLVSRDITVASQNVVDTTAATVSLAVSKDSFEYEFGYSYGLAAYYEKQNNIDITLYDSDGDYVEIKFIDAVEEAVTRYQVILYKKSTDETLEKTRSRIAVVDKLTMTKVDLDAGLFSGTLKLDVNLDRADYDVVTIDFEDIEVTRLEADRF